MKNVALSGGMPKRNGITVYILSNFNKIYEVVCALFILLFLYTAISKTFQISNTITVIKKVPVISSFSEIIAWSVVISEYVVAALLFFPTTRRLGLYISTILMTIFSLYICYMLAFTPTLPCTCGGVIEKFTWPEHLIFNILLTLIPLSVILIDRKATRKQLANNSTL